MDYDNLILININELKLYTIYFIHMRKIIFTVPLLSISLLVFSQDKILKHSGEMIECKIIELTDKSIKYSYENESLVNSIPKSTVSEINLSSGRTQAISQKIVIKGIKDAQKVIVTNLESDINGLKRLGEVTAKGNSGMFPNNVGAVKEKVLSKLKMKAAGMGGHIILILTESSKEGGWGYG